MPSPTSTTPIQISEPNKLPGVHYAITPDGIELPVVDITHPAFALSITEAEQKARVEKFLHEGVPLAKLPKPLRELALKFLLHESILAQGVQQARVTFMSGLQTYLLKLGPQMLGSAYAKPIDRQIAASLPSFCVRLRLQDMAEILADTLLPMLRTDPHRPLRLLKHRGRPSNGLSECPDPAEPARTQRSRRASGLDRRAGPG